MNLCDICSQLSLSDGAGTQYLGAYGGMESKSLNLGPGLDGCGGCQFFCNILRNSDDWSYRVSQLPGYVINFHSLGLEPRRPEHEKTGSSWTHNDLLFDICTADNVSGAFPCIMSVVASLFKEL
jgi:hypothetical protein